MNERFGINENMGNFTLNEIVGLIIKYRYLILLVFLFCFSLAVVYLFYAQPLYMSSGKIMVEDPKKEYAGFNMNMESDGFNTISNAIQTMQTRTIADSVVIKTNSFVRIPINILPYIASFDAIPPDSSETYQVELLNGVSIDSDFHVIKNGTIVHRGKFNEPVVTDRFSMIVKNKVPESFGISFIPVKNASNSIISNLSMQNITNTNFVSIQYKSPLPQVAKDVVNAFMQEFKEYNLNVNRYEATQRRIFLEEQFGKISKDLETAENAYMEFIQSAGAIDIDQKTNQLITLLNNLEQQRIENKIKIQEAKAAKEKSEMIMQGDPELAKYTRYSTSLFSGNPLIQSINSNIVDLQIQQTTLSADYSESHPKMQEVRAEIDAAKKQLEEAVNDIINESTEGVDPTRGGQVINTFLSSYIDIEVTQQVLNQINEEIHKIDSQLSSLPRAEVDQAQLERKRSVSERLHNSLMERLAEARIVEATAVSNIQITDWAVLPQTPISPSRRKAFVFALFAGIVLNIVIIGFIEQTKTTFLSIDSIERDLGLPVVSVVPKFSIAKKQNRELLVGFDSNRDGHEKLRAFEVFNTLRMNLLFNESFTQSKTMAVVSAIPKEGKSTIVANLGVTVAHSGKKVLIIDCDFHRPVQHKIFNIKNDVGFTDYIYNGREDVIAKTEYENLFLLPTGPLDNIVITELINNSTLISTIQQLQDSFDLILLCTPPVSLCTDAVVLSSFFKNALIVLNYNTNKNSVLYLKKLLQNVDSNIVGIVVNNFAGPIFMGAKYGYGSRSRYYYYKNRYRS